MSKLAGAALALALSAGGAAVATPVSVTQSLVLPTVNAFGTFSTASVTLAGWSSLWPFTDIAQISSVTLTFTSNDRSYNDPTLFPTESGGGIPGVELGFIDEGSSSRRAISSVNAAAPSVTVAGADPALFAALLATLLDGNATFSLGGFVNFAGGDPPFSTPRSFSDGTLLVQVIGDVADQQLPEPASLALVASPSRAVRCHAARV